MLFFRIFNKPNSHNLIFFENDCKRKSIVTSLKPPLLIAMLNVSYLYMFIAYWELRGGFKDVTMDLRLQSFSKNIKLCEFGLLNIRKKSIIPGVFNIDTNIVYLSR
jgi:hypothetical protein